MAESVETALRDQTNLTNNNSNNSENDTAYKFSHKKNKSYTTPPPSKCNGCGGEFHNRTTECKAWGQAQDCNNCICLSPERSSKERRTRVTIRHLHRHHRWRSSKFWPSNTILKLTHIPWTQSTPNRTKLRQPSNLATSLLNDEHSPGKFFQIAVQASVLLVPNIWKNWTVHHIHTHPLNQLAPPFQPAAELMAAHPQTPQGSKPVVGEGNRRLPPPRPKRIPYPPVESSICGSTSSIASETAHSTPSSISENENDQGSHPPPTNSN